MTTKDLYNLARSFGAVLWVIALAFSVVSCQRYDVLVTKDQVAAEKWANLEAQLERRADLVPNLVSVRRSGASRAAKTNLPWS